MKGAIYGDIIGSRFEFDRGPWSKEFELFTNKCSFTDDSVMSVAVAEALMNAGVDADEEAVTSECVKAMQKWGRLYPDAGYGGRFRYWLIEKSPKPYNSWGNGSAMRDTSSSIPSTFVVSNFFLSGIKTCISTSLHPPIPE